MSGGDNLSNKPLNPLARKALENLKYETADELGLIDKIKNTGWEDMTTREVGKIGGNMVRKMIKKAEKDMVYRPDR